MQLYDHQKQALEITADKNRVAYYHDMGLGKTFTGAQKMIDLGARVNLVICQKSKIDDWVDHFNEYYKDNIVYDLTRPEELKAFFSVVNNIDCCLNPQLIGVINYELAFRRPDLRKLKDFTLVLDESSMVKNETAKRSRFILKLAPQNVVLLSGTPTGGKYEELWSQLRLLGWNVSKKMFYNNYVEYHYEDDEGFPRMVIDGYKNEARLKRKMRDHGCHFLKTCDVFDLPDQVHQTIKIKTTPDYKTFRKYSIVELDDGTEILGENVLTQMLGERKLCGAYNPEKLEAFMDLVESTSDRLIVFYNFNVELAAMVKLAQEAGRPVSIVNGQTKDLENYNEHDDSITFIQYQAGAMGLNLQKANKIIYFSPTQWSELFEQSKKRIHRIGQDRTCFYYYLTCKNSIEERIYQVLKLRRDYTEALFEEDSK